MVLIPKSLTSNTHWLEVLRGPVGRREVLETIRTEWGGGDGCSMSSVSLLPQAGVLLHGCEAQATLLPGLRGWALHIV